MTNDSQAAPFSSPASSADGPPASPGRKQTLHHLFPYALMAAVTAVLYGQALGYDFLWDDFAYIHRNIRIHGLGWENIRAIWSGTYLGHYAPVHHTVLAVLHQLSGGSAFGFHLGQLILHLACAWVLYRVLLKLELPRVALLASLLFVLHPTNVETVAWISETKSTAAFLFFLLSFRWFIRYRETTWWGDVAICAGFFLLSMLAKVNTIVAPAVFLFYDYREQLRFTARRATSLAVLFLISGLFALLHLGATFQGSRQAMESVYYGGLGVHLMNLPRLVLFYLRMTFFPHPLSGWRMFTIHEEFSLSVGVAWVALLALLYILFRQSRELRFWGLWFLVFLAPVLQIIPFPIWVADRYLYIPAIGLFVILSRGFVHVADRCSRPGRKLALNAALVLVFVVLGVRTFIYVPVWRNDVTLWEDANRLCSPSPYCQSNLGMAYLQRGDTDQGLPHLIRAVEIRPIPRYLVYLADAYAMNAGDYRQALIAYQMAERQGGSEINAGFYGKLARLHLKTGDSGRATEAIEKGKSLGGPDPNLLGIEAISYWMGGRWDLARAAVGQLAAGTGGEQTAFQLIGEFWGEREQIGRMQQDLAGGLASPVGASDPVAGADP